MDKQRENDLVIASNEFAFIQDTTNGAIDVIVGPFKKSLAGTDQPMTFDNESRKFIRVTSIEKSIQTFPNVNEGSYIVLSNPSIDEGQPHPKFGTTNPTATLSFGKKINLTGPLSFPLWPGQIGTVVEGHQLRSNQYLVVQVYNEDEARHNWAEAIIKPVDGETKAKKKTIPTFTTGQLLIIKGTEVAFYIPPTGIEVLTDEAGNFVREAVTLERLEYCMLLDENGEKRYVEGPEVVFPEPTETFVRKNGNVKFKAIELTDHKGIYIKVIADYDGHKAGEELFITGKDQKIYFPRAEHAIIKYDNKTVHYAIAIPKGEARYVLNRDNGEIITIQGPAMFLPNPINEVVVRRVLSNRKCELWFPGNEAAIKHNEDLLEETLSGEDFVRERSIEKSRGYSTEALYSASAIKSSLSAGIADFGDELKRKSKFTAPRSITLDTKFDGAVVINVWPGYAVQVVNKTGERNVVIGPAGFALDYDQTLEVMELSTGKPKTDHDLLKTVYLRVKNNRISDIVNFVTKDLVAVSIRVNFNVNFEGDTKKWFDVENYVKFLTQHLRSIIRNVMKGHGIDEVQQNAVNIIRDAILGKSKTSDKRSGRAYEDNGMKIYDVEVLSVDINDREISQLLEKQQREVVEASLTIATQERKFKTTERIQDITRKIAIENAKTDIAQLRINTTAAAEALAFDKKTIENVNTLALERIKNTSEQNEQNKAMEKFNTEATLALQDILDKINAATVSRNTETIDAKLKALAIEHEIGTKAYTEKLEAIQTGLIEAIITAGKTELLKEFIENMPTANGEIGHLFGLGGWAGLQNAIAGTGLETAIDFGQKNGGVEVEVEETT